MLGTPLINRGGNRVLETIDEVVGMYLGNNGNDAEAVTQLLTELRGYCDATGVDFEAALFESDVRRQDAA
jgi:hypothetical protein